MTEETLAVYKQCEQNNLQTPKNEVILIFGGSGSLGTKLVERWIGHNTVINVSRDEEKQWVLRNSLTTSENLFQFTGDISDYNDVEYSILHFKPTVVIVAAAMKHIDLCEKYPSKSIQMNVKGIANIQNIVDKHSTSIHTVLFVSTDKACAPITVYGHSKAIAESFIQNYSGKIRFIGVRYGNVLNSSGSILHYLRKNKENQEKVNLTHTDMTRFLMTLDQSVNLIEYALASAYQNEIIIPYLSSMKIQDLFALYCEKYSKAYAVTGLRCKEKIHEDLLSSYESPLSYEKNGYIHLTRSLQVQSDVKPFNSSMFNLSKNDLKLFLHSKEYI
jgi:UDP-N-acetylglucosamine 4,6-dehydratase